MGCCLGKFKVRGTRNPLSPRNPSRKGQVGLQWGYLSSSPFPPFLLILIILQCPCCKMIQVTLKYYGRNGKFHVLPLHPAVQRWPLFVVEHTSRQVFKILFRTNLRVYVFFHIHVRAHTIVFFTLYRHVLYTVLHLAFSPLTILSWRPLHQSYLVLLCV